MTHKERAEQRRKMTEMIMNGNSTNQVAYVFQCSTETVRRACRSNNYRFIRRQPKPKQPSGKEKRIKRNLEIAESIRSGHTIGETMSLFKVGRSIIEDVCREYKIRVEKERITLGDNSFRVIALRQSGLSQTQITKQLGISRQRVSQIVAKARKAGIQQV